MIQIVLKNHWVTHVLQGTDMSSMNKGAGTYNSKNGCCMNGKKIFRYRQKHISPGRIQYSRVVLKHLVVKVKTAQIHKYR